MEATRDQPDDWHDCIDKKDFVVHRHKEGSHLNKE